MNLAKVLVSVSAILAVPLATACMDVQPMGVASLSSVTGDCPEAMKTDLPSCRRVAGDSANILSSALADQNKVRTSHSQCASVVSTVGTLLSAGAVWTADAADFDNLPWEPGQQGPPSGFWYSDGNLVIADFAFMSAHVNAGNLAKIALHEGAHAEGLPDCSEVGPESNCAGKVEAFCTYQSSIDPWAPPVHEGGSAPWEECDEQSVSAGVDANSNCQTQSCWRLWGEYELHGEYWYLIRTFWVNECDLGSNLTGETQATVRYQRVQRS